MPTRPARPTDAALRGALTSYLHALLTQAAPILESPAMYATQKGPHHPFVRLVNREAERLLRAFRAAAREQVRQLPGRAQKGAVDAALRSVTPTVERALNGTRAKKAGR